MVVAFVALLVVAYLGLQRYLHPADLPPSPHLSTVEFHDVLWLDWLAGDYFQPEAHPELPSLPTLLVTPGGVCHQSPPFMVAVVSSLPSDTALRQLIRDTWGKALRERAWPRGEPVQASVEVVFVLGLTPSVSSRRLVEDEAQQHGDLIVGDFADSYRNLTLKTLTALKWASHKCSGARFLMKVDQDTLVDFPRLLDFLLQHQRELSNAVIGNLYFNSKRLTEGKWKVSDEEYPLYLYPTFAGGPCYLVSGDAVGRLLKASYRQPRLTLEDVMVTGVLAKVAGVRRLHMQQLENWWRNDACCAFLQKERFQVSMTELSPAQLRHVWSVLTSGRCVLWTTRTPPPT